MPNKYKLIFEERKNLNEEVNPIGTIDNYLFEEFYIDTWYNKPFFGRVDTKGNSVIPKESKIKFATFATDPKQVQALDFVADLFKELKRDYEINYKLGNLNKKSEFFKDTVSPTNGFTTSRPLFLDKIKNLYSIFLDYIIENNFLNNINDYESFIIELKKFISQKELYITRCGFVESKEFLPLQTGLVLDIYDGNGSDSSLKERFYNDINYPAFLEIAIRHGFLINREIPWRLVCDIRQKIVAQKIASLTINSANQIKEEELSKSLQKLFDVYYDRVIAIELKEFQYFNEFIATIEGLYKSFIFQFPKYKTFKINDCGKSSVVTESKKNIMNFNNLSQQYKYYLSLFFDFRKLEIKDNLSDDRLDYIKMICLNKYDSLSKENYKKAVCESINLFVNNTSTLPYRERSIIEGGPKKGNT